MKEKIDQDRINELTEKIAENYLRKKRQRPEDIICVDIEGIAKEYFGMNIVYERFAEKDPGKDAFTANGAVPLRVTRGGRPRDIIFPEGTVVLDTRFAPQNETVPRRFILAHEIGHVIYAKVSPGVRQGYYHTVFDRDRVYSPSELAEQMSVAEAQASRIGCALLMPRFLVGRTVAEVTGGNTVTVYGDYQLLPEGAAALKRIADDLGVSPTMLMIRLRRLGMLEYRPIGEYLEAVGMEVCT